MKKAIMYGGGNIGRGFIGKVFSESGYEVCFLDIMDDLINEFNKRGEYPVRIVSNEDTHDDIVKNVRAVNSLTDAAIDEIATCDIMATAVGVNVLPKIASTIAKGAVRRMETSGKPLDIILCENQLEADKLMRGWINECLTPEQKEWTDKNLGLVEASIGRMVPALTPEQRAKDMLFICVEPYALLPVDSAAFKGEIPNLKGLVPYTPFGFYIKRKLFIHNMGHAICAYLGYGEGCEYIWQAAEKPEIVKKAREAMMVSAHALAKQYGEDLLPSLEEHVDDLLSRFKNKKLGDPVKRVGGDPIRKLRSNDRIIGAALYALEQGIDPTPIIYGGVKAALAFDPETDEKAQLLQKDLKEKGIDFVIENYMGIEKENPLYKIIKEYV